MPRQKTGQHKQNLFFLIPHTSKNPNRSSSKRSSRYLLDYLFLTWIENNGQNLLFMGKLIVKAALSVFICCLIYEFFDIGTGIPFYSGIATIICLQPEIRSTFRVGMNRTVGTLIGGFTGMAVLFIIREFSIFRLPTLQYLLISFCILPLMISRKPSRKIRSRLS